MARWAVRLGGVAAVLVALFFALPVPRVDRPSSTVLLDREGHLLGAAIAADEQWRFPPLAPGAVPPRYAAAVLTFEDRRFRSHPGVDPLAVARAVWLLASTGEVRSGASTLTMQVVRIARRDPPRTLPEKLWEMALALRLESAATKDEILAIYASNAPFGGNTVGLEAAAFRYFGRAPDELSWGEAATLAVLPNSPSLARPGRGADTLRARRDRLLGDLVAAGHLTAEEAALARAEPLPGAPRPVPALAPHLLDKARAAGTWRVRTTLDPVLQARVLEVAGAHHERLAARGIHNLAVVVLDNPTGDALAWVGNAPAGGDREHGHAVDVVTARRSTGSTLKPLLYEAMLEEGALLPDQLVLDLPVRLGGFAPENYDREYEGALPASQALARSRNVPAVWLLREYGVDRFHARLHTLGLTTIDRPASDYGLSLILGGAEGTLLELTDVYRLLALAAAEVPVRPAAHWRADAPADATPVAVDPGAAWATLRALLEVSRPGVEGSWRAFARGRPVAWKTGTSFGYRDGWAVGTTPELTVGVWVGNASGEGRPDLTGTTVAAPLLFDVFDLLPPTGWFEAPDGALVEVDLCADSGMRAGPDCPHVSRGRIPRAGLRSPPCSWCERIHCDATCEHRANADCAPLDALRPEPFFVLPPAVEGPWIRRHPTHRSLPPWAPGCAPSESGSEAVSLVTPREGSEVVVPVELDGARGAIVFRAAHRDPRARLWWHLDGEYLGETTGLHEQALAPEPGEHLLVLVDGAGGRLERRFVVR